MGVSTQGAEGQEEEGQGGKEGRGSGDGKVREGADHCLIAGQVGFVLLAVSMARDDACDGLVKRQRLEQVVGLRLLDAKALDQPGAVAYDDLLVP